MQEELFSPSLSDESNNVKTKTYDLPRLFLVAFFGGIIPITILGARNAKWLNVDKKKINLLIGLGTILFISELIFLALYISEYIIIDNSYINFIYRIVAIVLYLLFYNIMKTNFNAHIYFNGEITPLLKDALIWICIGIAVWILITVLLSVVI